MADARFEEGGEGPLYLGAQETADLQVIAALVQDAVFPITEITWARTRREFAILLNRFRWEDLDAAQREARGYERVRSLLAFRDVLGVQSNGIDKTDRDTVLSLLDVTFEPGLDGTGRVVLTLAGDGQIALQVEALDAVLRDVTRPYLAPSRHIPRHPD